MTLQQPAFSRKKQTKAMLQPYACIIEVGSLVHGDYTADQVLGDSLAHVHCTSDHALG